jgi:hypothetical protein
MVFYVLLAVSCCCLYVALRARSWPLALAAFLLAAPTALVASLPYYALIWWACLLLALTIGLRWSADTVTLLGLLLAATAFWFIAVASPIMLHWPRELFWMLPFGVLVGLFSLVVSEPPWAQPRA